MSKWSKEELENMLEDVVNVLDLSETAIEKHGPLGTAPAELVRLVLQEKDLKIRVLEANGVNAMSSNCNLAYVSERFYTEKDLIAAAKYGYEYRDTTSFPQKSFEYNCENNVKQWIVGVLNAR